jgi:hypothetical protein
MFPQGVIWQLVVAEVDTRVDLGHLFKELEILLQEKMGTHEQDEGSRNETNKMRGSRNETADVTNAPRPRPEAAKDRW